MQEKQKQIARFLKVISRDSDEIARHGCPFGTLSSELEKHNPSLRGIAAVLITEQVKWKKVQFRAWGKSR